MMFPDAVFQLSLESRKKIWHITLLRYGKMYIKMYFNITVLSMGLKLKKEGK
jgi:hypothetical protein